MDSNLIMWGAIVSIVFLAIASKLISQWIHARYRATRGDFDARLKALEEHSQIGQLDERIRVLESIVTDHKGNLRQKIDAL